MIQRLTTLMIMAVLVAACRAESPPEEEPDESADTLREVDAEPVTGDTEPQEPPTQEEPRRQVARVRVVDLDGNPVAGIHPIATTRPNAFDEPVTQGPPSGSDGRSRIAIDPDQWLYIRAWDPTLARFANNYYEAPPGDAPVTRELELIVVPHAALRMRLTDADGRPVVEQPVGIMMSHPDRGPWWPTESVTDADGDVVFTPVPAGSYLLTIQTEQAGRTQLPEVHLPPGIEQDIGAVPLQPQ